MNLIMIGVVSLLATCTFRFWRIVVDRELTFELHAIRDELRWLAIERPELRDKQAFLHFDRTLQGISGKLDSYSFWTTILRDSHEKDPEFNAWFAQFMREVEDNPAIKALFLRFGSVLIDRIRARHVALLALFRVALWAFPRKQTLRERVVRPAFAAFG